MLGFDLCDDLLLDGQVVGDRYGNIVQRLLIEFRLRCSGNELLDENGVEINLHELLGRGAVEFQHMSMVVDPAFS